MNALEAASDLIRDGWGRFRRAWMWVLAQYVGLALLIALGMLWTRIPEQTGAEVALTLALPVLVLAAFFWLQAGFLRSFLRPGISTAEGEEDEDEQAPHWSPIAWGAATMLVWVAVGWGLWLLLDKLDGRIFQWASYLNSKLNAHARMHWASFEHLSRDLYWAEWALRWVVVPGLLIPAGACSAGWGILGSPWGRVVRVWASWKWWPMVLAWALIGEAWPQTWFESEPHGAVRAQVGRVVLKFAGAYLLGVTAWVKVLGWGAMRVNPRPRTRMDEAFLTLGLEAPAEPLAETHEDKPNSNPVTGASVTGRPLPKGGEDGSGHA